MSKSGRSRASMRKNKKQKASSQYCAAVVVSKSNFSVFIKIFGPQYVVLAHLRSCIQHYGSQCLCGPRVLYISVVPLCPKCFYKEESQPVIDSFFWAKKLCMRIYLLIPIQNVTLYTIISSLTVFSIARNSAFLQRHYFFQLHKCFLIGSNPAVADS